MSDSDKSKVIKNFDEDKSSSSSSCCANFIARLVTIGKKRTPLKNYLIFLIFLLVLGLTIAVIAVASVGLNSSSTSDSSQTTAAPEPTSPSSNVTTTTEDPYGPGPWQSPLLSGDMRPEHYDLEIRFEPELNNMEGDIKIDIVNYLEDNVNIVLHANKLLEVEDPKVYSLPDGGGDPVRLGVKTSFMYTRNDYFVLELDNPLAVSSRIRVDLQFRRDIGVSEFTGLFMHYGDHIATNFMKENARKVFPCFDDPRFKATFNLTLEHPDLTYGVSTTEIFEQQRINPTINPDYFIYITKFAKTNKMSPHSLGFYVVNSNTTYNRTSQSTVGNIPITIFSPNTRIPNQFYDFALDAAAKLVDYFQTVYFNNNNGLAQKIDLVALPDLTSDVVENWGLFFLNEANLLHAETKNSIHEKQRVALSIAKAICSMWIGSLVTPKTWSESWFQEGMVEYLRYKAVNELYPDLNIMDEFLKEIMANMWEEAYINANPKLFDSYKFRIAALMRHVESLVGEINFKNAIQNYIQQNLYSTGEIIDFVNYLILPAEMDGVTAVDFLENWIETANYPVVDLKFEYNQGKTILKFVQSRFLISEQYDPVINPAPPEYKWLIHMQCTAGGIYDPATNTSQNLAENTYEFKYFLRSEQDSLELNSLYSWVKCNNGFYGFYLISYLNSIGTNLGNILDTEGQTLIASPVERAYLIHNSFLLAFSGLNLYNLPAQLSDYLFSNENEYLPFSALIYHMNKIADLIEYRQSFFIQNGFANKLLQELKKKWDIWDDSGSTSLILLKSELIDFMCRLQVQECLDKVTENFKKIPEDYFTNPTPLNNPIPPNFRYFCFKYQIQNTDSFQDWLSLRELYGTTIDPHEQRASIYAVSYTKKFWLLNDLLKSLLYDEANNGVKNQDVFRVITNIGHNSVGRYSLINFFNENYIDFLAKYQTSGFLFGKMIAKLADNYENQIFYKEIDSVFSNFNGFITDTDKTRIKNKIETNILWVTDRERDLISDFFKQ